MTHVFISYSHADRDRVADLVRGLEQSRVGVWWDEQLPAGPAWDDQIESALENARAIVVVWSRHAVTSQNVKDEAHYALDEHKALSVRIENVTPPYRWRRVQHVDLFERPPEANAKWPRLIEAALRNGGADMLAPSESAALPRPLIGGGIHVVYPALLVLASLFTQFIGTMLAAPGAVWPLAVSGTLGTAALLAAVRSLTR